MPKKTSARTKLAYLTVQTLIFYAQNNSSKIPPRICVSDAPIDFLFFHAAELYLKSYLRQKGEDVEALKRFGHYHRLMCKKAAGFGLNLSPQIWDVFEFLDKDRRRHREPVHSDRF